MTQLLRPAVFLLCLVSVSLSKQVLATEIRVAVASNFLLPMKSIADAYQQETGDRIIISAGSTGKLYAQIVNGAPYDVFLAANSREPERLEKNDYAESGSRFTYAEGRLVLWDAAGRHQQELLAEVLKADDYRRLAIANPSTAPYGAAAFSVLKRFDLEKRSDLKILRGENVSQAYQYVASGAAELGFVALAQLKAHKLETRKPEPVGTYWLVSERLHEPILQQAILLTTARNKQQALAFLDYLKGHKGRAIIENFGYSVP